MLNPNIKDLPFCRGKALSHSEGQVATRLWELLAENCCGKLLSHLEVLRVEGPPLMKDVLISYSRLQGLQRRLKSCQPSLLVGVMQLSIWGHSFSTNAHPCRWYPVPSLLQLTPSPSIDSCRCRGSQRGSSSSTQKCLMVPWSGISPWTLQDERVPSQGQVQRCSRGLSWA